MKTTPVVVALVGGMLLISTLSTRSSYAALTASDRWSTNLEAVQLAASLPLQTRSLTVQMTVPAPKNLGNENSDGAGPGKLGQENLQLNKSDDLNNIHGSMGPGKNPSPSNPGSPGGSATGYEGQRPGTGGTTPPGPVVGEGKGPGKTPPSPGAGKGKGPLGPLTKQNLEVNKESGKHGNPPAHQPLPVSLQGDSIGQIRNLTGQSLSVSVVMSGLPGYRLNVSTINLLPGAVVPLILEGPDFSKSGTYQVVVTVALGGFTEVGSTEVDIKAPAVPVPPQIAPIETGKT